LPYPVPADPADVPSDVQALANRLEVVLPTQIGYAEITASVNSVPGITTVVDLGAITFSARPILLEFFSPDVVAGTNWTRVYLFDGANNLGIWGHINSPPSAGAHSPMYLARRLTPSAGSHDYSARAQPDAGTGVVGAGPGGPSSYMPAFLRATYAG
jgi:hypothetical protein